MSNRFDKVMRDDESLTREQELELLEKIGSKGPPKRRGLVVKKPAPTPEPASDPAPPDDRGVFEKLLANAYENKLQWPSSRDKSPEAKAQRDAYNAEEARQVTRFKEDLFKEFGVENNPRRQACFDKAWSDGHASGLEGVASCFSNLVDLITPTVEERNQIVLTRDEAYVVFAALCTMVEDVHAPQDQMTEDQWKIAEGVYRRLEIAVDKPAPRRCRRRS